MSKAIKPLTNEQLKEIANLNNITINDYMQRYEILLTIINKSNF